MTTKEIIIFTKKGKAMRTLVSQFPIQRRNGIGIGAMKLREGDEIVSVVAVASEGGAK